MFSITLSDKLNKQNSHTNKTLMSIERLADVLIALRCGSPRDDHRYALVRQGIGAEHHSAWFRQWGFAVGAGGFIGMGEKDVIVPFNAVQFKTKDNNKWYPVMNTTKDALKNAPGYKYDNTHGKSSAVSLDFQGNVIAQ
jgi:hypothetical protein